MKKIFILIAAMSVIIAVVMITSLMNSKNSSALGTYDFAEMDLVQLEEPSNGQPMAVINTSAGTIKAVLYPEYAPNTVDNFVNRANEGFYNGKDIYAIVEEAFFLTGAYDEAGTQGFTNDGNPIANECDVDLWTFKGALCAYSGQAGFGDSRFFVINNRSLTDDELSQLRGFKNEDGSQKLPEELLTAFVQQGSVAHFAGCYTVFGQTIEGYDVIDKICTAEIDPKTARPVEELIIESIEITEYKSEKEAE